MTQLVADGRLGVEEAKLLSPDDMVWFANTEMGRVLAQRADGCRREVPFVYALPVADGAERMVLRGVIDCLVETEDGLLILDYKTDRVPDAVEWERRIDGYSLQVRLYVLAAAKVFGRPVAGAALILLRQRRVVPVPVEPPTLEALWAQVSDVGQSS